MMTPYKLNFSTLQRGLDNETISYILVTQKRESDALIRWKSNGEYWGMIVHKIIGLEYIHFYY